MLERLLTDREVSALIGRARPTLQKDRTAGAGIPFVRLGGQVRYRESDVRVYLAGLPAFTHTSDGPRGQVFPNDTRGHAGAREASGAAIGNDDGSPNG